MLVITCLTKVVIIGIYIDGISGGVTASRKPEGEIEEQSNKSQPRPGEFLFTVSALVHYRPFPCHLYDSMSSKYPIMDLSEHFMFWNLVIVIN